MCPSSSRSSTLRYARALPPLLRGRVIAGRTEAMSAHFGDLLPPNVLGRSTKASFTETLWGPETRAFAESWDGGGVDLEPRGPGRIASRVGSPSSDLRSLSPLQAAWLAEAAQG